MVTFSLVLVGCNAASKPELELATPPIVTYSPQTLREAADQLKSQPSNSALHRMLKDYKNLRSAIRRAR